MVHTDPVGLDLAPELVKVQRKQKGTGWTWKLVETSGGVAERGPQT